MEKEILLSNNPSTTIIDIGEWNSWPTECPVGVYVL